MSWDQIKGYLDYLLHFLKALFSALGEGDNELLNMIFGDLSDAIERA